MSRCVIYAERSNPTTTALYPKQNCLKTFPMYIETLQAYAYMAGNDRERREKDELRARRAYKVIGK